MSFISRAEAMVERGEHFRALMHLLSGIRKDPSQRHALDLAVDLYIGSISVPGVERDLLLALDVVPDGIDIYEFIEGHLNNDTHRERYIALKEIRERDGLVPEPPAKPIAPARSPEVVAVVPPRATEPPRFGAPAHAYDEHGNLERPRYDERAGFERHPRDPYAYHDHRHATGAFEPVGPPAYDYHPAPQQPRHSDVYAPHDPLYPPPPQQRWTPVAPLPSLYDLDDDSLHERETATTGMFSSIDAFLDDSSGALEDELRAKSKRRVWLFGAIALVVIALVLLFLPSGPEPAVNPSIAQPLPALDNADPPQVPPARTIQKP